MPLPLDQGAAPGQGEMLNEDGEPATPKKRRRRRRKPGGGGEGGGPEQERAAMQRHGGFSLGGHSPFGRPL